LKENGGTCVSDISHHFLNFNFGSSYSYVSNSNVFFSKMECAVFFHGTRIYSEGKGYNYFIKLLSWYLSKDTCLRVHSWPYMSKVSWDTTTITQFSSLKKNPFFFILIDNKIASIKVLKMVKVNNMIAILHTFHCKIENLPHNYWFPLKD
jgi:hypothetical protein